MTLVSDVRQAARSLCRNPGFALAGILLLAVGMGANVALFSLFEARVLKPFPYPHPERVVQLWRTHHRALEANPWSSPDYADIHAQCSSLSESGAFHAERFNLGGDRPRVLQGIACTPGVLRALGVQPALGRGFNEDDTSPGRPRAAILSHACWTGLFGADPGVVGRPVRLDAEECRVVGVMPASFEFYSPVTGAAPVDLWVPLAIDPGARSRDDNWLQVVGRLKAGVTTGQANAQLALIASRLERAFPDTNDGKGFIVRSLPAEMALRDAPVYAPTMAAVWLALLAACANLAILFLARGSRRQAEYGLRLALGASRGHALRLALAESLLLALGGAAAGLVLAAALLGALSALLLPSSTHGAVARLDVAVAGYALLLALVASLAAGLPPAWTAAQADLLTTLKRGGGGQASARTRHRFLRRLVSAQIGAALLLVNTAFLLLAGYRAAASANQALSSGHVLSAGLTLSGPGYADGAARLALWERLLERIRALPGVTAAGMTTQLPLRGGWNTEILADGETFDPAAARPPVEATYVSPGYMAAMGLALLEGRAPGEADGRGAVAGVVVNRALAERCWPREDPIGRRLRGNTAPPWFTARVVGVIEDVRQLEVGEPALPEIYFPDGWAPPADGYIVIRSAFDGRRMIPAVRAELAALDPNLALAAPETMAEVVAGAGHGRRTLVLLTQALMSVTLLLASVGLFGTLAFQAQERTREIGVRLALGASETDIARLVLGQAVPSVAAGAAGGILSTIGAAYLLRSFLQDVRWISVPYALAGLAILGAAIAFASWLPAQRAARLDPTVSLRSE
jgi:putative ABC transport system permease protein